MSGSPETRPAVGDRRDDIQGLRALAVIMVVAYHAGLPWPGGFTGPDVFFVVSGFVVTGMLLREQAATGRIAVIRFYLRRARRLAPALALVSIATLLGALCVFSPIGTDQQVTAAAVAAASTIRANLYFLRQTGGYFQPAAQANPFLHTWTLSVEEQFYLAFPLTLLVLWWIDRRWGNGRWTIALLSIAGAGLLLANIALSFGHTPPGWTLIGRVTGSYDPLRVAFFFPVTRAWEFVAGVVLALAAVRWSPGPVVRHVAGVVGAVLLVVTIVKVQPTDIFPGVLVMLPVVAALGLIVGGLGASASPINRALAIKPLVWLGDRSYSWYLWHWPLIVFARALDVINPQAPIIAAAVSLVPAALSFQFLEEPIRRRRVWPSNTATVAIAAASILAPLTCAVAFSAAVERAWGDAQIAKIRESAAPNHMDLTSLCASAVPLGDASRPRCVFDTAASRGTVLLIGDSHAGHFSEPFVAAAHALHYDAQLATAGGCPFMLRTTYFTDACRQFVEGSLAAIAARRPAYDAIVISNATTGYLDGNLALAFVADGAAVSRETEIAGWLAGLTKTIAAIDHRSPIVVVGAVPQFYQVPQCLRPTLFRGPTPGCGVWTADWAAQWRTDIITQERPTVQSLGATYLDAGARLCSVEKGCSAFLDGQVAYRDGGHLNVESSLKFAPDFRTALGAATASEHAVGHAGQ